MKLELRISDARIKCPHCGEYNGGFIRDPRGLEFECDYCDESIQIPMGCEITVVEYE